MSFFRRLRSKPSDPQACVRDTAVMAAAEVQKSMPGATVLLIVADSGKLSTAGNIDDARQTCELLAAALRQHLKRTVDARKA